MDTSTTHLPSLSTSNVNMFWGRIIADTLSRLGVTYAVISPGSRSAPLTIGFAANPKIETIPVLDERSAAFFALGLARQKNKPVALVCSSGTAAANFYPAIIEASISHTPLIVLTADRPKELQDCCSGQAMDQVKLYAHYPRWQTELALPELNEDLFCYLRQTILHAWERTQYPDYGPVHINIPFREPLSPIQDEKTAALLENFDLEHFFEKIQLPLRTTHLPDKVDAVALVRFLDSIGCGMIIVGPQQPGDPHAFAQDIGIISRALGWPVLGEGLSPLRNFANLIPHLITRYDLILSNQQAYESIHPNGILQIGPLPTSKVLRHWIKKLSRPTWALDSSSGNIDSLHGNTTPVRLDVSLFAKFFRKAKPKASSFAKTWSKLEVSAQKHTNTKLEACEFFFEGKAAWMLSQYLPIKTPVFVANSTPVRDVEYFWTANNGGYSMHFNRGVNGIDGTLSTALGIAQDRKPAILLTGDLAFLHDSNGLLIKEHFKGHLTIVLINNNGGGIFENLPISHYESVFERYFATPQKVNITMLAASHGLEIHRPTNWDGFMDLIANLPPTGMRLIELNTNRKKDASYRKALMTNASNKLR